MFSKIVIVCFIGSLFIQIDCLPTSFGNFGSLSNLFNVSSVSSNGNQSFSGAANNQSSDPISQIQNLISDKVQLDPNILNSAASSLPNALHDGISDPLEIPQIIAQTFIRPGIDGAKEAIDIFEQAFERGTEFGKDLINTGAKIGANSFKVPLDIFSNFI